MGVKMNFLVIRKHNAADPEIGFLTKSVLNPYGRTAAIPTACELM